MNIEELLKMPASDLSDDQMKAVMDHKTKEKRRAFDKAREDYESQKNEFVNSIKDAFQEQAEVLKQIKLRAIGKAQDLQKQIYAINGKEAKEQKSFQIKNKEDTCKVVLETQDRFEFTEEAQIHIDSIKEQFKEKFASRNKGFYNLLDSILMRNTKGDYDPKLLAKARTEVRKLDDTVLIEEFDKLSNCLRVTGSAIYCRVYEKDEHKKWKDISLNFSSL